VNKRFALMSRECSVWNWQNCNYNMKMYLQVPTTRQ